MKTGNASIFKQTAQQIDTGTDCPEKSRALVVFNKTESAQSGIAVFQVEMAWPKQTPFPQVVVTERDGRTVSSDLRDWREEPDKKERAAYRHLSFCLCFAAEDVPAAGWKTYLAAYGEGRKRLPEDSAPTPGFVVIETERHGGNLPSQGCLSAEAAKLSLEEHEHKAS